MLLTAYDKGIGSCWMTSPLESGLDSAIKEQFAVSFKEKEDNSMATYEEIRVYRNSINRFARFVGLETLELSDGYAKTELKIRPEFENSIGSLHGGVIFTLADTVTGAAASSGGTMCTTVNCSMNYLKPGIDVATLYGIAHRVKSGKTISVYDVEIVDENDTLFATGTFTYFNLNKPLLPEK